MSYCRFHNTLIALKDCYHNLDSDVDKYEKEARLKLIELCQNVIREWNSIGGFENDDFFDDPKDVE